MTECECRDQGKQNSLTNYGKLLRMARTNRTASDSYVHKSTSSSILPTHASHPPHPLPLLSLQTTPPCPTHTPEPPRPLLVHLCPRGHPIHGHVEHFARFDDPEQHLNVVENVTEYLVFCDTKVRVAVVGM